MAAPPRCWVGVCPGGEGRGGVWEWRKGGSGQKAPSAFGRLAARHGCRFVAPSGDAREEYGGCGGARGVWGADDEGAGRKGAFGARARRAVSWKELKEKGTEEYREGKLAEAVKSYTAALAAEGISDEDRALVLGNRAQCHLRLGEHTLAVEDCSAVLSFDAKNAKALFRRAQALEALGMKTDAVADYKTLLESTPGLPVAREALGRLDPEALAAVTARAGGAGAGAGGARRGVAATAGPAAGAGGALRAPTKEDMRSLASAEAALKAVGRQQAQTRARAVATVKELQSLALQTQHVTSLDPGRRTFRACGRGYIVAPRDELLARLDTDTRAAKKKKDVMDTAIEHLKTRHQEAQDTWIESYNSVRKSMGQPPVPKTAFSS